MSWWDGIDFDSAAACRRQHSEREAKEKAAEAAKAERRRAAAVALQPVLKRAEGGDVASMREVIRLLAEAHDIKVETCSQMPEGAAAYASWATRTIVIPPIEDAATFAVALHETGHILAGVCPGREPHRRDPSVSRWTHCIACETAATERAMGLVAFNREMFSRLQSALRTYRRTTPASAAAIERLDRVAGSVYWAERLTARRRFAEMQARQDRARRS